MTGGGGGSGMYVGFPKLRTFPFKIIMYLACANLSASLGALPLQHPAVVSTHRLCPDTF